MYTYIFLAELAIENKRLPWWSQLVQEDIEQRQIHWRKEISEWNV